MQQKRDKNRYSFLKLLFSYTRFSHYHHFAVRKSIDISVLLMGELPVSAISIGKKNNCVKEDFVIEHKHDITQARTFRYAVQNMGYYDNYPVRCDYHCRVHRE
jgi:hypothetical protein